MGGYANNQLDVSDIGFVIALARTEHEGDVLSWKYDVVVYVDAKSAEGGESYAELFERFTNPNGWYMKPFGHGAMKHIAPLAPGLWAFAQKALQARLDAAIASNIDRAASSLGNSAVVSGIVNRAGYDVTRSIRNLIVGGICPLYARPLSDATIERRQSEGFSGDKPLYRTGEIVNHIHYSVRGSEKRHAVTGKSGNGHDAVKPSYEHRRVGASAARKLWRELERAKADIKGGII